MMTTYDMLIQAVSEIADERFKTIHSEKSRHIFSLGYIINRHLILKKLDKEKNRGQNRICSRGFKARPVFKLNMIIILIFLAIIMSVAFTSYKIIGDFGFKEYLTHSIVDLLQSDNSKPFIEEYYWLGENDELKIIKEESVETLSSNINYEYHNIHFTFSQFTTLGQWYVNTENTEVGELNVGDHKGFYIVIENDMLIAWEQDGYIFTIVGEIDKNTAIDLAKLTKIRK